MEMIVSKKKPYRGRHDITRPIISILEQNRSEIHHGLSPEDREELHRVEGYLRSGCTGRPRMPIKNYDRLGQFVLLGFSLPDRE